MFASEVYICVLLLQDQVMISFAIVGTVFFLQSCRKFQIHQMTSSWTLNIPKYSVYTK